MVPRLRRDEEEQARFPDAADIGRRAERSEVPRDQALKCACGGPAGRRTFPGVLETIGYEPEMDRWATAAGRPPRPGRARRPRPGLRAHRDRPAPRQGRRRAAVPDGAGPDRGALHRRLVRAARAGPTTGSPSSGSSRGVRRSCARPRGSRATARCCAPTSTWRPSWSRCTRSRCWPRSSGWSRWPGRAGPGRWSCSPRPTWSATRTCSPRTWPTRLRASRWWWSARSADEGVDALRDRLGGRLTMALLGASGHGKSSLTNALVGAEVLTTRDDPRGRPRPAHVRTPRARAAARRRCGHRHAGPAGRRPDRRRGRASRATFADVEALAARCRFNDCAHGGEPGCAVRGALWRTARCRCAGSRAGSTCSASCAGSPPGPTHACAPNGSRSPGAGPATRGRAAPNADPRSGRSDRDQ